MTRPVKVAVVGSGLAGLTAAYKLSKSPCFDDIEFEVHLFEKASSLGMDSRSVSLKLPECDEEYRVDVPMRSFQGGYYPQLISLYEHLGVKFRKTDFSYSFSVLKPSSSAPLKGEDMKTTMIYNGASGREGVGIPSSLFVSDSPQLKSDGLWIGFLALARGYTLYFLQVLLLAVFYLRLLWFAVPIYATVHSSIKIPFVQTHIRLPQKLINRILAHALTRPAPHTTLREWAAHSAPKSYLSRLLHLDIYWHQFISDVIIPLFSAVCTAGEEHVWEMPIEEILDYVWLTLGTHHYVVVGGVREVAKRMTAHMPKENIHLSTPIVELAYVAGKNGEPTVDVRCTNGKVLSGFSHIVFATQANHATVLLQTYLDSIPEKVSSSYAITSHRQAVQAQIECLSQFTYCHSIVINHTDESLLPPVPSDRRDLNLLRITPSNSSLANHASKFSKDSEDLCLPPTYTMATHVLPPPSSRPSRTPATNMYQTTNPIIPPRPGAILSVAKMERAVVTVKGKAALRSLWREAWDQDQPRSDMNSERERAWMWGCAGQDGGVLGPLQGAGALHQLRPQARVPGIWICGSYAHCGIPLLEGCVVSGRNVVEQGIWVSEGVRCTELESEYLW